VFLTVSVAVTSPGEQSEVCHLQRCYWASRLLMLVKMMMKMMKEEWWHWAETAAVQHMPSNTSPARTAITHLSTDWCEPISHHNTIPNSFSETLDDRSPAFLTNDLCTQHAAHSNYNNYSLITIVS